MTDIRSELKNAESPLFLTHRQADRDSLGAAIGLQTLLGRGKVCTPDGTTKSARSLLQATEINPMSSPDEDSFDEVVVLDAPSLERISPVVPETPILIDHHESDNLSEIASTTRVDPDADATSFLVAQLALENDWQLSPDSALPLLVGIFADTENLTTATAETVELSGTLLTKLGHRAEEFSDQISRTPDSSRRNARTLGTLRANGFRSGDLFVAFSKVGAHESAAANALRGNDVDLALVFSAQSDGYRITGRASDTFTVQMSLGDSLLPAVADEFGGDGGGHADAGVASVHSGTPEMIEQFIIQYLERQLGITFSPTSGY